MDPVTNPYVPGAGRPPASLAGRNPELRAWEIALARIESGRTAQPVVLEGLRGVGKTVLLDAFTESARSRGWIVAAIEAKSGRATRALVGEALYPDLVEMAKPGVGKRILRALSTALSFKVSYDPTGTWNFGVDLTGNEGHQASTGNLETDLSTLIQELALAAESRNNGVALLIDEAHELPREEMIALCSIAHKANRGQHFLLALAGLPTLPRLLGEEKTYSERLFNYHSIGALSFRNSCGSCAGTPAENALLGPARMEGVEWDQDAATYVLDQAKGYPYFIQQFGQETWNISTGTTIGLSDAIEGVSNG